MNILLVTHYFWPEPFIISDLVKCLAEDGHKIEVLTGKPNYPDGVITAGFEGKGSQLDMFHQTVRVHRVPIIPRGKSKFRLLLNYLSFVVSGLLFFHRKVKKSSFDVIFVFMPSPIFSAIPAVYLKHRMKIPLVVWVQDLWPESAEIAGLPASRWVMKGASWFVKWIYQHAALLLMQSRAFEKPMSRYVSVDKLAYYPNSFLKIPSCSRGEDLLPKPFNKLLSEKDCFVFAGNIGKAMSLETLIEAARNLTHLPNCMIVLVGSGSMLDFVREQISLHQLTNMVCVGRMPMSLMPDVFEKAAGLLVTLKRSEIFSYTIPSKIQAYLSAGRVLIGALDGEGAALIQDAGAGFISPAEDGVALASNIEHVAKLSKEERQSIGLRGYEYFLKHFEMRQKSRELVDLLSSIKYRQRI